MAGPAKIESLDVLREVKAMLAQFTESASLALIGVDADIARVKQWLNSERPTYWKRRIRELEDAVEAAKAEIRRKELVAGKDPASVVDERKKLARAKARLDEAIQRAEATRRWGPAWEREAMLYKAACAPLSNALYSDIPRSIVRLERMMESLEEYVRLAAGESPRGASPETAGSVQREIGHEEVRAAVDFRDLRRHIPTEDSELQGDRALIRLDWGAGQPSGADRESLLALSRGAPAPAPGDTLTLAWRASTEPSVYFVRSRSAAAGQSGWHIGPVSHAEISGGYRLCRVGELLEQLPGLTPILALERGSLVVLTRGVIKAVLDSNDRDLWASTEESR